MDAVLRISPILSKLLDTLCLEMSINRSDQNSLGLIEILEWRINKQISEEEFSLLYLNWLQAKGILSVLDVKQEQIFDKIHLVTKLPQSFLNIKQITKCLEILNEEYNQQFLKFKKAPKILNALESIFNDLDTEGVIHLRNSQMLFVFMATAPTHALSNEGTFRMELVNFKKNIGQINGKISLRSFKNYLSTLPINKFQDLLKNLPKIRHELNASQHFPDLFTLALNQWYSTSNSKHQFREGKQKLELYRRILEEYDYLFFFNTFDPAKIFSQLQKAYGYQQMNFYDINLQMVRQFYHSLQTTISNYISRFLSLRRHSKPTKLSSKTSIRSSLRMSPIKQSSSVQRLSRTPLRFSVQKLSRSIDEVRLKSSPRKVSIPNTYKPSFNNLQDLIFVKGGRIESFESVMQRLKNRK